MFYDKQPVSNQNNYKEMLKIMGQLSNFCLLLEKVEILQTRGTPAILM